MVNHWASGYVENFATAEEGQVRKAFAKWVEELKVQRDAEKKDKKKKKKWKLIDLEPLVATVTLTVSFLSFPPPTASSSLSLFIF